jgi:hypothetical protein
MTQQPEKLNAAPRASTLLRVCVGSLAVCCSMLAVAPALAGGPGDRDQGPQRREERDNRQDRQDRQDRDNRQQQAQPQPQPQQRPDPRSFESRAEEHRRMQQDSIGNADTSRRVDRMTADERRDLRRQINEAGQEVYSRPPRH